MSNDTTPGQLDAIDAAVAKRFQQGDERMAHIEEAVRGLRAEMTRNTEAITKCAAVTDDIHEMLVTARVGGKLARWAGKGIAWALPVGAGAIGLWQFFNQGPKP